MAELSALTDEALAQIGASASLAALDELRVHWLGRKGVLTEQLKSLGVRGDCFGRKCIALATT